MPCFGIKALSTYDFVIDESEAEEGPDKPDSATALDNPLAGRNLEGLRAAMGTSSPESQRSIISHSSGIAL